MKSEEAGGRAMARCRRRSMAQARATNETFAVNRSAEAFYV